MIITIDGPAGAGKSTIARLLASRLGFDYLDTGAMYRSVALLGLRNRVEWDRPEELVRLAASAMIDVDAGRPLLDGEDVSDAIRSMEITQLTKYAANNPDVRDLLVPIQRKIAERTLQKGGGIITEGRDQGTVVFPDAAKKIFLTATPQERAKRRFAELVQRGETPEMSVLLEQINRRDLQDRSRTFAPLVEPPDALILTTDGMNIDDVLDRLVEYVHRPA